MSDSVTHKAHWSVLSKLSYFIMAMMILFIGPVMSVYIGVTYTTLNTRPLIVFGIIWGLPCVYLMYKLIKDLSKDVMRLPQYIVSIFVLLILVVVFFVLASILSMLLLLIYSFVMSIVMQEYGYVLAGGFGLMIVLGMVLIEYWNQRDRVS